MDELELLRRRAPVAVSDDETAMRARSVAREALELELQRAVRLRRRRRRRRRAAAAAVVLTLGGVAYGASDGLSIRRLGAAVWSGYRVDRDGEAVLGPVPVSVVCSAGRTPRCRAGESARRGEAVYELLQRAGVPGSAGAGVVDARQVRTGRSDFAVVGASGRPAPRPPQGFAAFVVCRPDGGGWACRPLPAGSSLPAGSPIYSALASPDGDRSSTTKQPSRETPGSGG